MIRGAINFWARSEVGLSRLPVTEEIAGSNPVGPARNQNNPYVGCFYFWTGFKSVIEPSSQLLSQSMT